MIARLPEMYSQLRQLSAQVATLTGATGRRRRPIRQARAMRGAGDRRGRGSDGVLKEASRVTRSLLNRAEGRGAASRVWPFLAAAPSGTEGSCGPIRDVPGGRRLGLLAGSGRFPIVFAEAARRQGLQVACVGIKYEAPDELKALCASVRRRGGRQARQDDPHVSPPGRPADRHGRQGHEERHLHALAGGAALARPPDRFSGGTGAAAPTTGTTRCCSP